MQQIIKENRGRIRAIIKKLTGTYNEDIEQEVFIKTWKNLPNYHEEGRFTQWISQLAANVCRDYFRSRQYKQFSSEDGNEEALQNIAGAETPEKIIDTKTRQKIILKAVDNLPAKYRQIVIWYEFEELSYEQIANKMRLPVGTIKSRLHSARQILAERLKFLKGE